MQRQKRADGGPVTRSAQILLLLLPHYYFYLLPNP
jgi:hypothetical protein